MQQIRLALSRLGVPPRYEILIWVAGLFIVLNTLVRLGLMIFEADVANFLPLRLLSVLLVGFLYDVAAASVLLVPFALGALVLPNKPWGRKVHAFLASTHIFALLFGLFFVAVAEFVFWNEFASRFNFIAVDYLIYTRETLGNIRQSFPVVPLFSAVAIVTVVAFWSIRKRIWDAGVAEGGRLSRRLRTSGGVLLLPAVFFFALGDGPRNSLPTTAMRELAGDGYYEFVRAFRANDLDFFAFYATMPERDAAAQMRHEFEKARSAATFTNANDPLERMIRSHGETRRLNVVLVTMESLGADFVESFGGRKGLTPNLDRLAAQGWRFTQMYATGTRTVRGLEALSLSIPPTPGQAVLKRQHNKGFPTLGSVLKEQGYEPLFIYGGYSYFDNMRDFFGGNGYTVVDRTSLSSAEISHETIWGGVRRRSLPQGDPRDRRPGGGGAQGLCPCDDHVEPSPVHVSFGTHRHSFGFRTRRSSKIFGLGDWRLHARSVETTLVQRYLVCVYCRSHIARARAHGSAAGELSHSTHHVCIRAPRAADNRHDCIAD